MRATILTIAAFAAISAIVSMGIAGDSQADVAKTKQRIWNATMDRG